jgi:hypothetical protein
VVALAVCSARPFTSAGDHREALAGLAGPRRLDRGVEGKEVGLGRDRGDQLDDVADLTRQRLHRNGDAGAADEQAGAAADDQAGPGQAHQEP